MPIIIQVRITPNASTNQVLGWKEGILRIKIRGVPEKGKVNKELVAFLADVLNIKQSQIEILSGHTSRDKRLSIEGVPELTLLALGPP